MGAGYTLVASEFSAENIQLVNVALCSLTVTISGWESQLLETGFLGIFLCPLWTLSQLPKDTPTSRIVLWGFRWLIFRIMLGAVSTTFSCNIWREMS